MPGRMNYEDEEIKKDDSEQDVCKGTKSKKS